MLWNDIHDIAIDLEEKYPEVDIINISFTDLQNKVMELDGFVGERKQSNEKILEAIQQAWIDERE